MELINHSSVTMGIIIVIDQSCTVTMGEIYGIILEGLSLGSKKWLLVDGSPLRACTMLRIQL